MLLTDMELMTAGKHHCALRNARDIEVAVIAAYEAKLREENEPVYWTHSCNVLCLDNVELWIDRCPHCGKPSTFGVNK